MVIDLHTHSNASDGTQRPAELVGEAAKLGLDVIALTDHDTASGWAEAGRAAREVGIGFVPGTEFSCRTGVSIHLLSYLHDPQAPALVAHEAAMRQARFVRLQEMVDRLSADFPITWEAVAAQAAPGAIIGRPHIADALVAAGVVPDRSAAFASMLAGSSPYYVRYQAPDAVEMTALARQAGGVPVIAHPRAVNRGRAVPDDVIEHMAAAGLGGIEVHHRDNPPDQQIALAQLANRLGLFITGSSDYHGAGKPNRLAENTTRPEALAEILRQGRGVNAIGIPETIVGPAGGPQGEGENGLAKDE